MREKTQVSLSNVRFGANKLHLWHCPSPDSVDQGWIVRTKVQTVREKSVSLNVKSFTTSATFAAQGAKTKLTVETRMFGKVSYAAPMLAGMEAGWNQSLDRLTDLVAKG